LKQAAGFHG